MKPTKILLAGWRLKSAVSAAFVVTLAAPIHALAGCGCSINDIACQNRCEMAETNAKNAREARDAIDNDSTAFIPEFKAARDKVWRTDPSSPDFTAVVNAYKAARNRKDKLLLAEYGMALPAVVSNSSGTLRALDEKYLVPQNARDSFHQFAMAKLKKSIGNPNLMGGRSQGYDAMDEFGGGPGSYFGYVRLADQEELNMYAKLHGGRPAVIDESTGAAKPAEQAELEKFRMGCSIRATNQRIERFQGGFAGNPETAAFTAFVRQCAKERALAAKK